MLKIREQITAFFNIPLTLTEDGRKRKMLDILLVFMSLLVILLIVFIQVIGITGPQGEPIDNLYLANVSSVIGLLVLLVLIQTNRLENNYFSRILFVAVLFFAAFLDNPLQTVGGRSLFYFSLPIISASIFLRPWAGFVMAGLSMAVIGIYSQMILHVGAPLPEMLGMVFAAALIWLTTRSLEDHIRQLRETNTALIASEERYRSLMDISPELVVVSDATGTIQLVNQAGLRLFGYTENADVVGKKNWDFIVPESRERAARGLSMVVQQGSILGSQYLVARRDGSEFWVEFSASVLKNPDGSPRAILSVGRDITLRKQMEDALIRSKGELEKEVVGKTLELNIASQRLDELVVHSPVVIYSAVPAEQPALTFVSANVAQVLGYEAAEFLNAGGPWPRELHPNDRSLVGLDLSDLSESGRLGREYRFLHKSGSYRWIRDEVKAVLGPDGKPVELVGFWLDITSQKQTEINYQNLVETSMQGLLLLQNGGVRLANPAFSRMVGIPLAELYAMPTRKLFEIIHPMDREFVEKDMRLRMKGKPAPVDYVIRLIHRNGQLRALQVSPIVTIFQGQLAEQIALMDITERVNAEEALKGANAMLEARVAERTAELVGNSEKLRLLTRQIVSAQEDERRRIARELHDESGQALIGIKYRLDEILTEAPTDLTNLRVKISNAIELTDDLAQSIRGLAHVLRPSMLDVAGLNLSLSGFCREFSEHTPLVVTYKGVELPNLSEDASITLYRFVQEALTNTVRHAHASQAHVSLRKSRNRVVLSVLDDGQGFDVEKTPKDIGLLGMQERLALLNGQLEVHSAPGSGTQVVASIPVGTAGK